VEEEDDRIALVLVLLQGVAGGQRDADGAGAASRGLEIERAVAVDLALLGVRVGVVAARVRERPELRLCQREPMK